MENIYLNEILPTFGSNPVVEVIRTSSTDFLQNIMEENSIDAIYIDALHTYKAVKKELEDSRKVVKPDGIIMSHDYAKRFSGVIKAVTEFCETYNLEISYITEDGCPSYYIVNCK